MEISIVYIAIIFLVPFALACVLVGAMAFDKGLLSRPQITALTKAVAKARAVKASATTGDYVAA